MTDYQLNSWLDKMSPHDTDLIGNVDAFMASYEQGDQFREWRARMNSWIRWAEKEYGEDCAERLARIVHDL